MRDEAMQKREAAKPSPKTPSRLRGLGLLALAVAMLSHGVPLAHSPQQSFASGTFTVEFDGNNSQHQGGVVTGSVPADVSAAANSELTLPGNGDLARFGFTFEGWQADGAGATYEEGDTYTVTADVTFSAQWGIPEAARLFHLGDEQQLEMPSTAGMRGLTTDGISLFFVTGDQTNAVVGRVGVDGTDQDDLTVTGDDALTVITSVASGNRDLAYSSGHIWVREDGTAASKLYAISVATGVMVEVNLPSGKPFFDGQRWLTGNIIDFPDGRIGAVSRNKQALDTAQSKDGTSPLVCPDGFYCKVLRLYDVVYDSDTPSNPPALTHSEDILLADDDARIEETDSTTCWTGATVDSGTNGWPCDDHGIATDGTYLYQSHHSRGYKVWALQSNAPSYVVFNGDGTEILTADEDACGAASGVSGGLCPISGPYPSGATMSNATYFTRDHVNERYMMGDFGNPSSGVLVTESRTPPPGGPGEVDAPSAPRSVSAVGGDQQAVISWSAPITGAPIVSYTVTASPGSETCVTSGTTCTIASLTNGTAYTFSVVARNVGGASPSATSNGVTPQTPGGDDSEEEPQTGTSSSKTPSSGLVPPTIPTTPPSGGRTAPDTETVSVSVKPVGQPVPRPGSVFDPNAPSRASVGGIPTSLRQIPLGPDGVSVVAGAFQFGVSLDRRNGGEIRTAAFSDSLELFMPEVQPAGVSGKGSYPGSFVQLWLPGTGSDSREIARIPVRSDGTFASTVSFQADALQQPVPVGRQVLQVVGYDEDGNQTVVDMTINIGQGAPAPEPNRQVGELPALSAGQSLATSGGLPQEVSVTGIPEAGNVVVEGPDWVINVNADRNNGAVETDEGQVLVRLDQSSVGTTSGSGFMAGTLASVWLFSEPTLMATVTVDDNGDFSSEFLVDARLIAPGEHTLQVQGVGNDGLLKAANLGVLVEQPVVLTSEGASSWLFWVVGVLLLALLLILFFVLARRRRSERA